MAGLLDLNDPQSMGLLSLGLRLMSTPGKFGAALGTAGMGALGDMQQAQARQQQSKQMEAAERMRALQEQMTMLELERAKQQQAAQGKRESYLGSVSPSQGPAMPVDMAQALAAGLSPQEASALMPPKPLGEDYKVVGNSLLQIGPQGVKEAFRAPDTGGDKDLALLEMIHGKGTPEFMRAAQQLAQKRTTHAPAASVSYGAPMAGTDAAGNPVFFQPAKGGGAPAIIPGVKPPADKGAKPTEDQSKAAGWLVQASNAYNNMLASGFDKQGNPLSAAKPGGAEIIAAIPGIGDPIANTMRSADRQKFIQAASSLSEALLRAATGAGVNMDEARQKMQELTPIFGEDAETTKQKMAAIPLYLESLKVRAGPAAAGLPVAQPPTTAGPFTDAEKERRYQEWKRSQGKP